MDRPDDDPITAVRTDRAGESFDPTAGDRAAAARPPLPEWEAAVAPGARCLAATSCRYRVTARNPARAALAALQRHGLTGEQARAWGMCVAVHLMPDTSHPRAVFEVAGPAGEPGLRLRYSRLLPATSPLLGAEGPFDANAVAREVPRAARRRAQARIGSSGLAEVLRGTFWQREATLYSSTALVLSAFGFPMSAEVFAVGGVILLIQGAVRLVAHEARIFALARGLLRHPDKAVTLRQDAQRRLFLRAHELLGPAGRQIRRVLRERVAVPDLTGSSRLMLLIDEDAAVTTGAGARAIVPADTLPPSDNILTVVFRRPRRPADAAAAEAAPAAGAAPAHAEPAGNAAPGRTPALPIPVARSGTGHARDEEIEVIEAELLDPESYYADRPVRDWWA
jgi:hypothetical protein